jgi:cyclophilin family peptidyl-prolyl cis-trans isomerase
MSAPTPAAASRRGLATGRPLLLLAASLLLSAFLATSVAGQPAMKEPRAPSLLLLEEARSGDVAAWLSVWERAAAGEPRARAAVLRGVGRCAHPRLEALLRVAFQRGGVWTEEEVRAAAFAAGHLRQADLFAVAARERGWDGAPGGLVFALALQGGLPREPDRRAHVLQGLRPLEAAELPPAAAAEGDPLDDDVVAALAYGARLPGLQAGLTRLAERCLLKEAGLPRRRAAWGFFARSRTPPSDRLDQTLRKALFSADDEMAGAAAEALATVLAPPGTAGASDARGRARFPDGVALLVEANRRQPRGTAAVRRLRALGRIAGPDQGALHLLEMAVEADETLRATAWDALAEVVRRAPEVARTIADLGLGLDDPLSLAALAHADPARFAETLPALRLGGAWEVRRAAVTALLGGPHDPRAAIRWMDDPDRRVRLALLTGLTARVQAEEPAPGPLFECAATATAGVLASVLRVETREEITRALPGFGGAFGELEVPLPPGDRRLPRLCGGDPVLLGCGAKLLAVLLEGGWIDAPPGSEGRGLIEAFWRAVPASELEPHQAILALAAALPPAGGERALRAYARSPAIDLRRRARARLQSRGAEPLPPEVEGDLAAARRRLAGLDDFLARWRTRPLVLEIETLAHDRPGSERGRLALRLDPLLAPRTCRAIVRLAEAGYYDGLLWHRVIPAFVAQAGCPRGDGWGGPGWTLRCETSARPYRRGTLGMALAGHDTGSSQWFVAHRPLPHLQGRYTVFGEVVEGLEALASLRPGDRIRRVRVRD